MEMFSGSNWCQKEKKEEVVPKGAIFGKYVHVEERKRIANGIL